MDYIVCKGEILFLLAVDITYGAYDIVFRIETTNKKSLVDNILNDITGISKIKETQTLPIFS